MNILTILHFHDTVCKICHRQIYLKIQIFSIKFYKLQILSQDILITTTENGLNKDCSSEGALLVDFNIKSGLPVSKSLSQFNETHDSISDQTPSSLIHSKI